MTPETRSNASQDIFGIARVYLREPRGQVAGIRRQLWADASGFVQKNQAFVWRNALGAMLTLKLIGG
jgi:hypothetical protein